MSPLLLLILTAQLGLLTALVWQLELVSEAFAVVALLTLLAFPLNRLMPPARRPAFFLFACLGGLVLAVGWEAAAWVVGLGCALIALAHLPGPLPGGQRRPLPTGLGPFSPGGGHAGALRLRLAPYP